MKRKTLRLLPVIICTLVSLACLGLALMTIGQLAKTQAPVQVQAPAEPLPAANYSQPDGGQGSAAPDGAPAEDKAALAAAIEEGVENLQKADGVRHLVVRVDIEGPIDDESTFKVEQVIKNLQNPRFEAIVLEIDSGGGNVHSGYDIIRAIEASRIPIYCIADEKAMSMAFYILQGCQHRLMTSRTVLMIHEQHMDVTVDTTVDRAWLEDSLRSHSAIARGLAAIGLSHIRMSRRAFEREIHDRDWYLNWWEALRLNMVDQVVVSPEVVVRSLEKTLKLPRKSCR